MDPHNVDLLDHDVFKLYSVFKKVTIKMSKVFSLYIFHSLSHEKNNNDFKRSKVIQKSKDDVIFYRNSSFRAMESGSESTLFGIAGSGSGVIE